MTISPGPTIASSVFSLADRVVRAAWSPTVIVPRAPRMSPTCASSSTAEGRTSTSTAVTEIHPFHALHQSGIEAHAYRAHSGPPRHGGRRLVSQEAEQAGQRVLGADRDSGGK